MKKILSVFLFMILAVSVTHAEGLVYTSGTGGPYKPTFTFSNTLRFNAKSNDVVELQKTLISKGYLKTEATGYFGKLTFAAVKAFQKDNKLKPDGLVGKVTKNLLIQEINKPISNGTPQVDVSGAINPQINTAPCTASTAPSINVTNPIAGASYIVGDTVVVNWTSCNVQNVYVGLVSGGKNFGELTPNGQTIVATQGMLQFTAFNPAKSFTDLNTNNYQVVVQNTTFDVTARSGIFTITSPTSNPVTY